MDKGVLVEAACQDLLTYGVWDGKDRLKYWIRRYLLRRRAAPEDLVFWPTGLLAAGLWQCRQETVQEQAAVQRASDKAMIDLVLAAYYDRWLHKGTPVFWLDDLLAGETLLEICREYQEKGQEDGIVCAGNADKYRKAADRLADFGMKWPTNESGSFPYRRQDTDRVFADTMGLACPFLYRYGVIYDRQETMEAAVKQIVNFLAYGMDVSTGLPYHGFSIADDCKYGIIGWGRAVGWMLRGMDGCMVTEYGRQRLEDSYVKMMNAVLGFQRKDGFFSWQLQAGEGPADTSATAMICASLKKGTELGILKEPKYGQALMDGRSAIEKSVRNGRVYQCSGECEGFGQYPQRYGAYPWALGSALML